MNTPRKNASVLKATTSISVITLLSRILGLVRDAIIARCFGAGLYTDAFYAAFKIPNLLRRLVAEGSLTSAFVPVFTDELGKSDDAGRETIRSTTTFVLVVTTVLTILGIIFATELTNFFAPGWDSDTYKGKLAAELLQLMFPFIIFVSLSALSTSALNALNHYALPASAQAILNVCMIIGGLASAAVFAVPIIGLAWSVILGGVISLIPQVLLLKRLGFPMGFGSVRNSPALGRLVRLMLPSVVSSSLYQCMIFVNLVLASMLQEGSVSWLYYADRLFQFPLGVFSLAVAQAVLPSLARFATAGDTVSFSNQLTRSLNWISIICIPAAVGLFVLSDPIIRLLYEGGTFTEQDTLMTAQALQAYSLGLWALSAQSILVRAFLAYKDAVRPAIVSSLAMVLNMILAFMLMGPALGKPSSVWGSAVYELQNAVYIASFGHSGLAIAGSIAAFFALIALALQTKRLGVAISVRALAVCFGKSTIASCVMGAALFFAMPLFPNTALLVFVLVPSAAVIYFFTLKILRLSDLEDLTRTLILRKR